MKDKSKVLGKLQEDFGGKTGPEVGVFLSETGHLPIFYIQDLSRFRLTNEED
jgi:hypothetical protein